MLYKYILIFNSGIPAKRYINCYHKCIPGMQIAGGGNGENRRRGRVIKEDMKGSEIERTGEEEEVGGEVEG